jgi:hypothetical protein
MITDYKTNNEAKRAGAETATLPNLQLFLVWMKKFDLIQNKCSKSK